MIRYLVNLTIGKTVLWCYFLWYLVTVFFYFDPALSIWLNSIGLSLIIGVGLNLSVAKSVGAARDSWQTFRLFLIPFCVSSFSSLIKGHGFVLVIPPRLNQLAVAGGACVAFASLVFLLKRGRQAGRNQ